MEVLAPAAILAPVLALPWVVSITHYRLIKPSGFWRWVAILLSSGLFLLGIVLFLDDGSPAAIIWSFLLAPLALGGFAQRSLWSLDEVVQEPWYREEMLYGLRLMLICLVSFALIGFVVGLLVEGRPIAGFFSGMVAGLMISIPFVFLATALPFYRRLYRRRLRERIREIDADCEVCCRCVRDPLLRFAVWLARKWAGAEPDRGKARVDRDSATRHA